MAVRALVLVALLASLSTPARAAQTVDLHSLTFLIHVDVIGAGGRDLAGWQAQLDETLRIANTVTEGDQGPFDLACCTRIEADAALVAFGTTGDGFDVIDDGQKFDQLEAQFASQAPVALIVLDISFCAGTSSATIVGCAATPGEFLIVDVQSLGSLGVTLAHERGHNAGLLHPNPIDDPCELMSPSNSGGCLGLAECQTYSNAANAVGGACSCLGDAVDSGALANGTTCTDAPGCGVCSGGLCGACLSEAGIEVFAAGDDPDAPGSDGEPGNGIGFSALSGGWTDRGPIGANLEGMAYDHTRGVVFGVGPTPGGGNDRLVTVDPATGMVTATVGTLDRENVAALAYDDTHDLLWAISLGGEIFGDPTACDPGPPDCVSTLFTIDPETAAVEDRGPVNDALITGGISGLAYDPQQDILYGSNAAGFTIHDDPFDLCRPGAPFCATTDDLPTTVVLPSALTFDPVSGLLMRVGDFSQTQPVFQSFDPDAPPAEPRLAISVDGVSVGALAAVPVPEPAAALLRVVALGLTCALSARRPSGARSSQRRRRAGGAPGPAREPAAGEGDSRAPARTR